MSAKFYNMFFVQLFTLALLLTFLVMPKGVSVAAPEISWIKYYTGTPGIIKPTPDGRYMVTGGRIDTTGGLNRISPFITILDSLGTIIWSATYPMDSVDVGNGMTIYPQETCQDFDIIELSNGRYAIIGNCDVGSAGQLAHIQLVEKTGELVWSKIFNGLGKNRSGTSAAWSIADLQNGDLLFAGGIDTSGFPIPPRGFIMRTNNAGDYLWYYTDTLTLVIEYIIMENNGIVYVTHPGGLATTPFIKKIDFTGATLWQYGFEDISSVKRISDNEYMIFGVDSSINGNAFSVDTLGTIFNIETFNYPYSYTSSFPRSYFSDDFDFVVYVDKKDPQPGVGFCNATVISENRNGDTLWTLELGDTICAPGYRIYPTNDSGYIITGYMTNNFDTTTYSNSPSDTFLIVKIAPKVQPTIVLNKPGNNDFLAQNPIFFSSPFSSTVRFITPQSIAGEVTIFDLQGNLIRRMDLRKNSTWDGSDHEGNKVAPGIYNVVLVTRGGIVSKKIVKLAP